ncbi:hypothetical protein G7070_01095 [Propioniciclava coleopterorum]|uniref:SUKH-4 immunity protein n=1 Tax=Propioniciclava coleopterorum TaxID=2714937 RepID=A0A6G7Y3B6_9ACTN|nr:SUKH-4 family immunity protein [Propioniciclava coleopterorum]QIK71138.1 hypothetical protein G7070_01095 [Propioniciclava coleopterorum]
MAAQTPLGIDLLPEPLQRPLTCEGRPARVIGTIAEECDIVEFGDDGSVAVHDRVAGETHPLNRDRPSLESFLDAFATYLETGPPDVPPTIYTAGEMAARLADLRAGRIKPQPRPAPQLSHRKRLARLRARLTEVDAAALARGHWWRGTLEEARDDLL